MIRHNQEFRRNSLGYKNKLALDQPISRLPSDPSTVYETQLADHLANRCNSRPRPPDSWISPNCNVTLPLTTEELEFQQNIRSHKEHKVQPWIARVQLAELTRPDLDGLVAKVRGVFEREVREIRMEVLDHEAMRERRPTRTYANPIVGVRQSFSAEHIQLRHNFFIFYFFIFFYPSIDQASLLGHMKRLGMLDDKSACFIEFGAGRDVSRMHCTYGRLEGELSSYLKAAVNDTQGEATYMLVDRKNVRGKFDKNLIGSHPTLKSTVKRVGCDIKDLDLSRIDILQGGEKKVVALSKHLCGSATDITLKCLVNYLEKEREKGNGSTIAGIVIAICCHQLCRWPMYPNPTFLADIGFTQADFERVCKMTSWAICGQRPEAVEAEEEQEHELAGEEEGDADDTG
ncbi:methyltransferase TRM13-domain-containing protein [Jimgerdemannia flammicorona]|uniref:tRNA:m(4)X modification enzyme TRM13 n=1 Tax=Jimgerdemannia flammicorona TaxID=994334 RepID=A0A433QC43_9FUNG|nr:methyltransferase TRM13-domain-containing protein [Jimgerdemannia flammicorona]